MKEKNISSRISLANLAFSDITLMDEDIKNSLKKSKTLCQPKASSEFDIFFIFPPCGLDLWTQLVDPNHQLDSLTRLMDQTCGPDSWTRLVESTCGPDS